MGNNHQVPSMCHHESFGELKQVEDVYIKVFIFISLFFVVFIWQCNDDI